MMQSLAVVSGKGGSGKTLIATALAREVARTGGRVLLIDADLGTAGLSYYLGFSAFSKVRGGFAEFMRACMSVSPDPCSSLSTSRMREVSSETDRDARVELLGAGDHRFRRGKTTVSADGIRTLIECVAGQFDVLIFDCRGGIDEESLSVCAAVSDILVVVETDAAAIRSSQYLTDVLSEEGLHDKVRGFVLNKVMDDPTPLAKAGVTFFEADFLGAVPFDIQTTRDFIRGELPKASSLFQRHVNPVAARLLFGQDISRRSDVLKPEEFSTITLRNPDAAVGTMILGFLAVLTALMIVVPEFVPLHTPANFEATLGLALVVITFVSLSEVLRESVGKVVRSYQSWVRRLASLMFR